MLYRHLTLVLLQESVKRTVTSELGDEQLLGALSADAKVANEGFVSPKFQGRAALSHFA